METLIKESTGVEFGPLLEQTQLSCGIDYYKFTMSQLLYNKMPDVEVTFTLHNRDEDEHKLSDYVDPDQLQARLDQLRSGGWQATELEDLASKLKSDGSRVFSDEYLTYLAENELPRVSVGIDPDSKELAVTVSGDAPLVTFWETIAMSETSEQYFNYFVAHNNIDVLELYAEGERRITDDIAEYNDIGRPISEFGVRRRASLRWQKRVDERLIAEMPDILVGTSNTGLARELGIVAVGTFAHELGMIYAAVADAKGEDIRAAQQTMLDDLEELYGVDGSILLTDTFRSEAFFEDFKKARAERARGTRQDSGDPLAYGERIIQLYQQYDIDNQDKTIVFSDNLKPAKVRKISEHFAGQIEDSYGIGTRMTNNLGEKKVTHNIVMKAMGIRLPDGRRASTVKLSDEFMKQSGPKAVVERYRKIFNTQEQL